MHPIKTKFVMLPNTHSLPEQNHQQQSKLKKTKLCILTQVSLLEPTGSCKARLGRFLALSPLKPMWIFQSDSKPSLHSRFRESWNTIFTIEKRIVSRYIWWVFGHLQHIRFLTQQGFCHVDTFCIVHARARLKYPVQLPPFCWVIDLPIRYRHVTSFFDFGAK